MQLGMEAQKIDIERQRRADEAEYRKGMQALAQAQEGRAQAQEERAKTAADFAMGQAKADQQVGGMMAEIDQLGAQVSQTKQRSLDDYAKIGRLWGRLQENPSLGTDPATGQERPNAKWVRAQALLGPQLKDEDLPLLDQYQQKLQAAAQAAANMSPQQQAQFRAWSEKLALRDLDSNARQGFARSVADNMRRGAYRVMLENGEEVDDDAISARVMQLSEMAADPSVPTANLRQMNDSILKEVQSLNDKQSVFVTRKAELTNMWNQAYASGNSDVSKAARGAYQAMKQGLRGPALDEMINNARQGNVKVYDMDNKPHIFPSSTADENLKAVNALIMRANEAETKASEEKPRYYENLGKAALTRADNAGETPEQAARRQAKEDWRLMAESEKEDFLDKRRQENPDYSSNDYINERAQQYLKSPQGGGSGTPAGAATTTRAQIREIIGDLTAEDKEAIARAQVGYGLKPRGGNNLTKPTDEEQNLLDQVAVMTAMERRGYKYNPSSGYFFNPETKRQVQFSKQSSGKAQ
jgi:hypothetical protein